MWPTSWKNDRQQFHLICKQMVVSSLVNYFTSNAKISGKFVEMLDRVSDS